MAFAIRSKIWIEDMAGNVVFGLGRYLILEAVTNAGSLQGAAKELKMSYRSVWMRIRTSEKSIGKKLVVRAGKGSCLTPFTKTLIQQFKQLQNNVEKKSDQVYEGLIADELR